MHSKLNKYAPLGHKYHDDAPPGCEPKGECLMAMVAYNPPQTTLKIAPDGPKTDLEALRMLEGGGAAGDCNPQTATRAAPPQHMRSGPTGTHAESSGTPRATRYDCCIVVQVHGDALNASAPTANPNCQLTRSCKGAEMAAADRGQAGMQKRRRGGRRSPVCGPCHRP